VSRVYLVNDARGARRVEALPVSLGGAAVADIVLNGVPAERLIGYIALSDGHAFLQPVVTDGTLLHNQRRVSESVWLKSGDQVRVGDAVLHWTVEGDLVHVDVHAYQPSPSGSLAGSTPVTPPPGSRPPLPEPPIAPSPGRHHRWRYALGAALALLVLGAVFVLVATPVTIQITPSPATQRLAGFPPPVTLGERQLVWPGRYRVRATRPGYQALDEIVDIPRGGFHSVELSLRELPGEVTVQVRPPRPFRLQVDGLPVPVDNRGVALIERGRHQLRVEADRYLPVEQSFAIEGLGKAQQLSVVLEPAWAVVHIDSQPGGADVQVDGEPLGNTPLEVELLQGERTLRLSRDRYKPLILQQTVVAGVALALDSLVLEPADGQVVLDSVPQAVTVLVDGEYRGTTPLELSLSSTVDHRLQLAKPGYETLEHNLRLEPQQQRALTLKLAAEYGTVFVSSVPADAQLRVDGKAVGRATRRLRLPTRSHRLEIYQPGYLSQVLEVTPRAGVSQNLDVVLKTAEQARQAAVAEIIRTRQGQRLRLVRPAGPFRVGASRREPGRRANESVRLVQLTRPFYFGEKEVTNAEYRAFRPAHRSGSAEGASLDEPRQPVVNVGWDDAARYCNWLSEQEGLPAAYAETGGRMELIRPLTRGYRLPTEVEWAYVARVPGQGEAARYPWQGNYPPTQVVANFADARIGDALAQTVPNYDDRFRVSAPVGSFAAYPPGFYDLAGNVAEWMSDYYSVYPGQSERLVKDPAGPVRGEHHLVRGSSWRHGNITELRLSYRDYSREPRDDLGFRLARYVDGEGG
jgi:formylglycine-generating enzyme required for sulfatase activity